MIINQYFVLWQVKLDKGFALQAAPPFILLLSVVFALDPKLYRSHRYTSY